MKVDIVDLSCKENADKLCELIDTYMIDPMGGALSKLTDEKKSKLIDGLKRCSSSLIFFCNDNNYTVGASVCFIGFSTFLARPLINIHDLIVLPQYRKKGVGTALMLAIEQKAIEIDCCKITLEVRYDNIVAKNLYKKNGFSSGGVPMEFWIKNL